MSKDLGVIVPYKILAFFGPSPMRGNGVSEVRYYCPKCLERKGTPDTKGKLYVNVESLKFNCFRCGYSGQLRDIDIDENKVYEATKELEDNKLIETIENVLNPKQKFPLVIPIDKVTTNAQATQYLLDRGFTYQQMEYYDLRIGNLYSEFGRIIIPNQVNKLVYTDFYSARTYIGQTPKYHNPKTEKSKIVFNLFRIKEHTPIIIVEGALTAIAAGYHAVATLGKTITKDQASIILQKHPSMIYVNYDYGAEEFALRACQTLYEMNPEIPIYNVTMPDERDAADMTYQEYAQILKNNSVQYNPITQLINELY